MERLKFLANLLTRAAASALAAFREAARREVMCARAASALARSAAMVSRTLANLAASCSVVSTTLLLAHSRNFLSWAAAWATSLERPAAASLRTLAILVLKAFMA